MADMHVSEKVLTEAKQHLFIALDEMKNNLPKTHEELIERLRDYFEAQKVEVFSKIVVAEGEEGFRDFIADTVVESGLYIRDEEGQVRVRA